MYPINSVKVTLVISQTALFLTALSYPAASQNMNFVDLNQSRQFFSEGNQKFEGEIKQFDDEDRKLPAIQLPQGYQQSESINKSSYMVYRQQKLKPITEKAIADLDATSDL
jgi:hypothetical protein